MWNIKKVLIEVSRIRMMVTRGWESIGELGMGVVDQWVQVRVRYEKEVLMSTYTAG